MADVHQVIDFRASTDAGSIQRSSINGGVGADFDIVFNLQSSNLRKFFIAASFRVAHVAEAVAAQHGAGVNNHTISEPDAWVKSDVRIQITISPNAYFGADYRACADPSVLADACAFTDDDLFFDGNAVRQSSRWMHDGTRVDAGLALQLWTQQSGSPDEGQARLSRKKQWLRVRLSRRVIARNRGGCV
jgi:hypothetical protein